jgi:serine phosphatase RsbU (regulator of sigma subunit)
MCGPQFPVVPTARDMRALSAVLDPTPAFGHSVARVLPSELPPDAQLDALQEQIDALSFEISALRRRDAQVHGVINRLDEEQRLAARLQQDFLPKRLPQLGGIHFHTLYRPAAYVSGDLYDVMRLDETNVGFYVADAVGHGMPAALLTMFMKNALVTKSISADAAGGAYALLEPAQTIGRLNTSLCQQDLSHATFATAIYGRIDATTLRMRFSTGGHPNPVVLRDGTLCELPCNGALLGIFPTEVFDTADVQLHPGDRVFVYTDGIEVAFADTTPTDPDRWKGELLARRDWPTDRILSDFADRLDACNGSLLPRDDLTIVAIEIT